MRALRDLLPALRDFLPDARDLHVYGGLALSATGVALVWPPGGLITAGGGLLVIGWRFGAGRRG